MYIEYLKNKKLTPSAKLLLVALLECSKLGKQNIYMPRKEYADLIGISPRAISMAIKELEQNKLIERVSNNFLFDQTLNLKINLENL